MGIEIAVNNLVAGNTNLGWRLRVWVWIFYATFALQRCIPIVPRFKPLAVEFIRYLGTGIGYKLSASVCAKQGKFHPAVRGGYADT